ncbi:hypothetical protein ASE88_01425 [Sphingomonas sp. Leaf38]|nr:hypothetical protein ASE88_01425 [Sphingomonas sp. Leaf38]
MEKHAQLTGYQPMLPQLRVTAMSLRCGSMTSTALAATPCNSATSLTDIIYDILRSDEQLDISPAADAQSAEDQAGALEEEVRYRYLSNETADLSATGRGERWRQFVR